MAPFSTAAAVAAMLLCLRSDASRMVQHSLLGEDVAEGEMRVGRATPATPSDCGGSDEVWLAQGHPTAYPKKDGVCFGLCSCYNTAAKMPKYVKYELKTTSKRPNCKRGEDTAKGTKCYERSHLLFKTNPALCTGCKKQGNVHACDDCSMQAAVDAEAFAGLLCPGCKNDRDCGKGADCPMFCDEKGSYDDPVGYFCAQYDAFENRTCPAWANLPKGTDYDLGHLAASIDTYDVDQAAVLCKRRLAYEKGGGEVPENHPGAVFFDYTACKWHASYMMTNIVPQASLFNRGCWKDIEQAILDYSSTEDLDVVAGVDMNHYVIRPSAYKFAKRLGSNDIGVPLYMWKAACNREAKPECIAWYMENRNFYMVKGCRTPLTLDELAAKLNVASGRVPGFYGVTSTTLLDYLLDGLDCGGRKRCFGKPLLYDHANENEVDKSEGTCYKGGNCHDSCQCCGVSASTARP